jgi:hypothetical protein
LFRLPLAAAWLLSLASASAQTMAATSPTLASASESSTPIQDDAILPQDPATLLTVAGQSDQEKAQKFPDPNVPPTRAQARAERIASLHLKYIPAGWKVLPLTRQDKVLLGLKDIYNPFQIGTIMVSAGYSHLVNGQPNFGTNGDAFAQRFGAAFARDTSEGIFTDAVFAPLLHQDPRYYVEGPDHSLAHRTLYAITRPLITRTDSGRPTPNGALLLGYAGASALSYTYYPRSNRNFHDTAATFGGGIGGAALGFAVTEFASPLLQKLHLAPR